MNHFQRQLLDKTPGLRSDESSLPKCKLCNGGDISVFDCVDFYKHCSSEPYGLGLSGISVPYYRCAQCNFIFTNFIDEWTTDEIAKYIYNADYLKVDPDYTGVRAIRIAVEIARHFAGCEQLRILDYGSGSGVFAEEMQRRGFRSVESYDPFSSPTVPSGHFDLITCFEVIEHSAWPAKTFADMVGKLSNNGAIIVGQTLQPGNIEDIGGRWWYLGPRNGHVSFFAEETFIDLAKRANLVYYRGPGFYAFARERLVTPLLTALSQIGTPVHQVTLVAPGPGLPAEGWQGTEHLGGKKKMFRWSTQAEVFWPEIELRIGVNLIHIPYLMGICHGFVEQCAVTIDGKRVDSRIERRRVIGEVTVSKPRMCKVGLLTPPPMRASDVLGTSDTRPLGLAVASW